VNVVDRFAQLVAGRDESVPLDEASLLVAAAVEPGIDIGREMRRLDELADRVPAASVPDVVHQLFRVEGFDGDHHSYYDPANSLLPRVLDRRVGIPITLSIVAIEVGRRAGVDLAGVGLPGHFLLGDPHDRETFVDPFSGGIVLDRAACRRLFHHLHGDEASWTESYLDAVGTRAILARMLANLRQIFRSQGSRQLLVEVLRLRAAIPGVAASERVELAEALAAIGRFDVAAAELDVAAELAPSEAATRWRQAAGNLRARLN
jgi:regulator of sirC expression with transglutaminase-like and TPR domain